MIESLPPYSLMSVPQVAEFLGCSQAVVRGMLAAHAIPSIRVGHVRKVDLIDLAVYVLAERERVTPERHSERHGEAAAEYARRYVRRILKAKAT